LRSRKVIALVPGRVRESLRIQVNNARSWRRMAPLYGSTEAENLLGYNANEANEVAPTAPVSRAKYVGLACAATALVAGVSHATGGGVVAMLSSKAQAKAKATTVDVDIDFIAYSADYSHESALKTASPHSFVSKNRLVEPIKDTVFEVSVPDGAASCTYESTLYQGGGPWDERPNPPFGTSKEFHSKGAFTPDAPTFTVNFPSPGEYNIRISCGSSDSASFSSETDFINDKNTVTLTDTVKSYYVRRELRELTLKDRNMYLDGFLIMHKTGFDAGKEKYGKYFRPLTDFEIMHLQGAAARTFDHLHDGVGLPTQHIAMTAEFELSLQSIFPEATVPYWDYTIDSARVKMHGGDNKDMLMFMNSSLFTEDFFGETDSESHVVTKGRFAYQELVRDYNFTTRSAYGFLRAPWNINPNKYVTRYHSYCGDFRRDVTGMSEMRGAEIGTWPTCDSHFKLTNPTNFSHTTNATDTEYVTYDHWAWDVGYVPHGPVHEYVGGLGGDCGNKWASLYHKGYINETQLASMKTMAFNVLKNLWRLELIDTPKYCAEDAPVSECMWVCHQNITTSSEAQTELSLLGFSGEDGALPNATNMPHYDVIMRTVFCDTAFWPGDHLEAASPIEASFWPIHPTIDRLLQYKDLATPFKVPEYGMMLQSNCSGKDCITRDSEELCMDPGFQNGKRCYGHNPYDITFFRSTHKTKEGAFIQTHLTNWEVRQSQMVKGEYGLPYLYNHYEFNHCDEAYGIKFKPVDDADTVLSDDE